MLNMALTAFSMVTSFFIYICISELGFNPLIVAAPAISLTIILGIVIYYLCIDRVKNLEVAVMIITIAVGMLFQEVFLVIFGHQYRTVPPFISGFTEIAGVRVTFQQLTTIGVSGFMLIGIWILLLKTRFGNAIRAVSEDKEVAGLIGIDVSRICMIVTAISVGLAAIAGAVLAPIIMVHPMMWVHPLIIVLAAAVLGGLGSIKGSFIAALMLAFSETIVVCFFPGGSFLRGAVSLSVMVVVLFLRPEGLFGIAFEEERL
jgi:branched-chain amino acid transport system permease protein